MLRHCLANVDYVRLHAQQQLRPKCGEIFYEQEANTFQLICLLCEMKHFGFEDFARHIRNVHFDKQGRPLTQTVTRLGASRPGADQELQTTVAATLLADSLKEEFLSTDDALDAEETEQEVDHEETNPLRIMSLEGKQSEEEETMDTMWQRDRGSSSDSSDNEGCDLEKMRGVEDPRDNQLDEEEDQQSVFKVVPKKG